jgi:hypothetical protein
LKVKSQKDFWAGLMFIVTGIFFAWGATNYSFGSSARPGPAYFPFGLGVLTAILGAIVLFKALTIEVEGGDRIGEWSFKPLFIICGAVALFGVLLPWLGLVVTLPLLVIGSATAGDEFRWKEAIINATVLTAFSWLIFIWPKFLVA